MLIAMRQAPTSIIAQKQTERGWAPSIFSTSRCPLQILCLNVAVKCSVQTRQSPRSNTPRPRCTGLPCNKSGFLAVTSDVAGTHLAFPWEAQRRELPGAQSVFIVLALRVGVRPWYRPPVSRRVILHESTVKHTLWAIRGVIRSAWKPGNVVRKLGILTPLRKMQKTPWSCAVNQNSRPTAIELPILTLTV